MISPRKFKQFLTTVGCEFRGDWQEKIANHILKHTYTVLQAPRQTGKTQIVAFIAALYVILGKSVIIALPTYSLGTRILFDRIRKITHAIIGNYSKKVLDQASYVIYEHGGSFLCISTSPTSKKEGYTCDLLIIDEGQEAAETCLGSLLPFIAISLMEGTGKAIILGRGGFKNSLIEKAKDYPDWVPLKITPEEVVESRPAYAKVFEDFKHSLTHDDYEAHVNCNTIFINRQAIFPNIPEVLKHGDHNVDFTQCFYHFGVDVGHNTDPTCVAVVRQSGEYFDLCDAFFTYTPDFVDQAKEVFDFIDQYPWHPHNLTVELNGMGYGLFDPMKRWIPDVMGSAITYEMKDQMVKNFLIKFQNRKMSVSNDALRVKLENLTYKTSEAGKNDFDHDDLLSAMLMTGFSM